MSQPLIDYYRCPAEYVHFTTSPALGDDSGFFRFGSRNTCYGRCAGPVEPSVGRNELADATTLVARQDHSITLPFDLAEVIDNLRMERYLGNNGVSSGNGSTVKALIRKAYYFARPALPVNIRKHLQRHYLRGWEKIPFPSWPVDNTVDRLCADLMTLCVQANRGEAIPFVWFWPEGYPSCAILTHDVEHEPGRAFCGSLMDLNDAAGIKSSFQVIPEERYRVTDSFLESIRARGFEVNIHDLNHDGQLFDNRELFLRRAEKINRYAKQYGAQGFRAGV